MSGKLRMHRSLRACLLRAAFAVAALGAPAHAQGVDTSQTVDTNIVTGGASGTYIQIGRDIAELGASCGLQIGVHESSGSIENMFAVRDRPMTQFGIVQNDVLEFFQTFQAEDPRVRRAASETRIVFPLYDEEVHVMARRDIPDLAGLAGKRVAVGVEASGTYVTASLVLDLAGVAPAERLTIGQVDALPALLAGEIDAFFYVAGAPAALFTSEEIDAEAFHLLPLEDPGLRTVYTPKTIPAGTYPWQQEVVETVAVKAILVTYDFEQDRNRYHRASCKAVSDVSHLIFTQLEALREFGHPKWQDIDLTALPEGWAVSDCVLSGLESEYDFACRSPDGTGAPAADATAAANKAYLDRICARISC